jgi:methionine synthase II (cobalamin-independent)
MSKFQPQYNQAKKKTIMTEIPAIDSQIKELQAAKASATNSDVKKGIDARIKMLQIKKKSFRSGDPIKEETLQGLEAIEDTLAKEYNISVEKVKEYADKIKASLDKKGTKKDDKYYQYVVGSLKKILSKRKTNEEGEGITTTSIGNSSSLGGDANFAPKLSMVSRNKTYKTCKKNKVDEFIDNLMN